MDDGLRCWLERQIQADGLDVKEAGMVRGALAGREALEQVLQGGVVDQTAPRPASDPPEVWLTELEVEGFRGVAEPVRVRFDPGPGLVVLAGRNGSGKSTLAEALDALLTGASDRWDGRSAAFAEGWRNLHHTGPSRVTASFQLAGRAAPLVVERRWQAKRVTESILSVDGQPAHQIDVFGGTEGTKTWRPVLSCGELARKVEAKPKVLFNAIAGVLGLQALIDGRDALRKENNERAKQHKQCEQAAVVLQEALGRSEEPRAKAAADHMAQGDLEACAALLLQDSHEASSLGRLRRLASHELPSDEEIDLAVHTLAEAAERVAALEGSAAGAGEQLARLLEAALALRTDQDCAVCGSTGVLDAAWEAEARVRIDEARTAGSALVAAQSDRAAAQQALTQVVRDVLPSLEGVEEPEAVRAWRAGVQAQGSELCHHVRTHWPAVRQAVAAAVRHAAQELSGRQAAWQPLAAKLTSWLDQHRAAELAMQDVPALTNAEAWLIRATEDLRAERFLPIRDEAVRIWAQLRQQSHVSLTDVALSGRRTRSRLDLRVDVDGEKANALGVMSQGELNALALSLFLPRTVLRDSPFRFVVVDDPVQAMDPHKVDGLARVLGALARERQTLVLTHDERLLESLRRQRIGARVLLVHRAERSRVQVQQQLDPIQQHLQDATKVMSAGGVSKELKARVVPGFCRNALEAALVTQVRRLRLGRGEAHAAVAALLDRHHGLRSLAALALFDDARRGREVEARLEGMQQGAPELFQALNRGVHEGCAIEPRQLVRRTRRLVHCLDQDGP
jgi:ABC-type Mn2+/Zn2+ transport system ATPase subunit